MRYTREFEYGTDENGIEGFIPLWMDGCADPFASIGMGFAHDCLEHEARPGDGDLEEELRALGAVQYIREVDTAEVDFPFLFESFAWQGQRLGDERPTGECEMEATFRDSVRRGIRSAIAEHGRRDEGHRDELAEFARAREWFVSCLCAGYESARERWNGHGWKARELFKRLESMSHDAAAEAEEFGHGTLRVEIDTETGKFSAELVRYENPTFGDILD